MSKIIVISSPKTVNSEIEKVVKLFECGLKQFHLRKPNFNSDEIINYLNKIPSEYHKHIVVHSNYHLAKGFGLKGIQVNQRSINAALKYRNDFSYFGYSAHSFAEITEHKHLFTHFWISPVYDSISKTDYWSAFTFDDLVEFISENHDVNMIALGGIKESDCSKILNLGFKGVALLGAIWQNHDVATTFNNIINNINTRAATLTIAGFDPSSGAGISADIKTMEQHKVIALGVTTAITYQNESEFIGVDWMTFDQIKKQIEILFRKHNPEFIKIGLIESFDVLQNVVALIKKLNSNAKIIWDPILKASAGFCFHSDIDPEKLIQLLQSIYLVTPNIPECEALFGTTNHNQIQSLIADNKLCRILLKGGHSLNHDVTDVLISETEITRFDGKLLPNKSKHGTGCVLSSAICANMANELSMSIAIKKGKKYVTKFINSNNNLLGFHNN